ncbi:MAG: hypothetical protein ACOYVG_16450 [Bacteroidota bacterium]
MWIPDKVPTYKNLLYLNKKCFAVILLLITLTAVFTPCCGNDECNEERIVMNEHQEEETGDNCSPFVTCGYCSGFI